MREATARASESPTALGAQRVVGLSPASPTDFGPTMNEEPRNRKATDSSIDDETDDPQREHDGRWLG
jgi:hypothetical protein